MLSKTGAFALVMFISTIIVMVSPSCTKTNIEEIMGDSMACDTCTVCDTSFTISYENDIIPTLQGNCYRCHGEFVYSFLGNGIRLDTYSSFMEKINDGTLLCAVKHGSGCEPMPSGGDKLSDCFILRLETWVNRGSNNN